MPLKAQAGMKEKRKLVLELSRKFGTGFVPKANVRISVFRRPVQALICRRKACSAPKWEFKKASAFGKECPTAPTAPSAQHPAEEGEHGNEGKNPSSLLTLTLTLASLRDP